MAQQQQSVFNLPFWVHFGLIWYYKLMKQQTYFMSDDWAVNIITIGARNQGQQM